MIDRLKGKEGFSLKGKSSNVLMKKMQKELKKHQFIEVTLIDEGEHLD
jgi:hypothetical protein